MSSKSREEELKKEIEGKIRSFIDEDVIKLGDSFDYVLELIELKAELKGIIETKDKQQQYFDMRREELEQETKQMFIEALDKKIEMVDNWDRLQMPKVIMEKILKELKKIVLGKGILK